MYNTECIVRMVVRRIAEKPRMLKVFLSAKRDLFLEAESRRLSHSRQCPGNGEHRLGVILGTENSAPG
jgi:hypothetical protein